MGVKISPEGRRTYDCTELIKAIDRYIAKADEDLKDQMEDAGYADAEESVSGVSELEDAIAVTLTDQTGEIIDELETAGDWTKAKKVISSYFANDTATRDTLEEIFQEYYETVVPSLANSYIKETAGDMVVTDIRKRTSAWMEEWSGQLADLMQLSSEQQMGNLVQSAIDKGESVADLTRKLMEEGIRNEEYKARRAAVTEMLRSHSVAQQEAMTQSPVVDRKKWRHSGSYKSTPRANHVAMDGKVVPKNEPFELTGRDGATYYPMYPRDSSLPPGESINCGCISQPVVDDDVLGMSLEERQKLQQEIIDADDGEWEKELDEKNRDKAGIESDKGTYQFDGPNNESQNYIAVENDANDKFTTIRNAPITATRVVTAKNNIYASNDAAVKRRAVHVIDQGLTETYEKMGISSNDNLPKVVILSDYEFGTAAAASYNATENVMYIRTSAGNKKEMKNLQKGFTEAKNYISTYAHEMFHWKDAQLYKAKVGDISNRDENKKYTSWIREKSRKSLEKIKENGYDINNISEYANISLKQGKYEEVYIEYKVAELLGG